MTTTGTDDHAKIDWLAQGEADDSGARTLVLWVFAALVLVIIAGIGLASIRIYNQRHAGPERAMVR